MPQYRADGPLFTEARWCDLGGSTLVVVEPGDVVDVPDEYLVDHEMQDETSSCYPDKHLWTRGAGSAAVTAPPPPPETAPDPVGDADENTTTPED